MVTQTAEGVANQNTDFWPGAKFQRFKKIPFLKLHLPSEIPTEGLLRMAPIPLIPPSRDADPEPPLVAAAVVLIADEGMWLDGFQLLERLEANEVVGSVRALVGDVPRLRPEFKEFKGPDWLNLDEFSPIWLRLS